LILENNFQNPWFLHGKNVGLICESFSRTKHHQKDFEIILFYFPFSNQISFPFCKPYLRKSKRVFRV